MSQKEIGPSGGCHDCGDMAGLQLRVLDVSTGIAGPFCARLLADYGADVIKVEPPEGDWSRREGVVRGDVSALYAYLNQNKRGITADLRTPTGQPVLRCLVEHADIMVESFAPGTLDKLGLGYRALKAINPRLVMVSLTDFGQTGPYRDYRATHFTVHALGGWLGGVGDPGREPIQMGYPVFHYIAGVNGAIGALAAVRGRRRTGRGQQVDISVFETCWFQSSGGILGLSFGAPQMKRMKRVPDLMKASDGWIGLTVGNPTEWRETFQFTGMTDVLEDEELAYNEVKKAERGPELEARLNDWARDKTREEIFYAAQEHRLGTGIVYTPGESLGCAQLVARNFFVKASHPKLGEYMQPGAPFRSPSLRPASRPAPGLGEHNEEVYGEIGLGREGGHGRPAQANGPGSRNDSSDLLAGTRIADLTHWMAGPSSTLLMGAFGADVIKIEAIQRPDVARYMWAPGRSDPAWFEKGYFWNSLNVNKRGITLDLTSERGKALFLEIVKRSDIVVENFSPRVLKNLGLEYAKLREMNPKLVMLSMSGFGQTGPWQDFKGYGPNFEMFTGASSLTGYQDGPPVRTALPDPTCGLVATFALLVALEIRDLTGSGLFIDMSQLETLSTFLGKQIIEYQLTGQTPARMGNRHPVFAPHNLYPCQGDDQWVAIAVNTEDQWRRLARLLGKPEWGDARFAGAEARKQVEDEIDRSIAEWTRGQDKRVVMEILQSRGIPAGAVQRSRDLVNDPHLRARNDFKKLTRQYVGEHEYSQPPLHFSDAVCENRFAGPTLGQHNEEVLAGLLGLSPEEIERLRAEKVIGTRPVSA